MFDVKSFLKNAYISGYKDGTFSAAYVAEKSVEQLDKGRFIEADVADIDTAIKAYDEQQNQEIVTVVYTAETEREEENNG